MNTAVVNVKVDPKVKKDAQRVAGKLGLSLSSLINGYLRQFIKTETVVFSTSAEIPNKYMLKALRENKKDREKGKISPSFDNTEEALAYLDKIIANEKKSRQN